MNSILGGGNIIINIQNVSLGAMDSVDCIVRFGLQTCSAYLMNIDMSI